MSLNVLPIIDAMVSHALGLGVFERVNQHEPVNPPGSGITAAIWNQSLVPTRQSGLASTAGLLLFNVRLYTSVLSEPEDMIDPNMMAAEALLMAAYSGDFTFGGEVMTVDLLGMSSSGLRSDAGYLVHDSGTFRVRTISVPLLVDDLFTQAP